MNLLRILLIPTVAWLCVACEDGKGQPSSEAPRSLDVSALGKPTFDETFANFDAGADPAPGKANRRWRTVMGYGGPSAFANRKMSKTSIGVDPGFPGVTGDTIGTQPLNLDPFEKHPGGGLAIVARPTPQEHAAKLWNTPYISGQINTKLSFSQRYGYFEVEAKLPTGKGLWPAFWLLPVSGKWPNGGEIDVFEGLGDPRTIFTTLHWGADNKQAQQKISLPFDASADFHRYGVVWTPRDIVWYADRREVMRVPTPPEVRQPMFILLNLAVGGDWGGMPNSSTRFPARLEIRRVTAWQLPPAWLSVPQ